MLRVKGVNFWPEAVDALVLSLPEVREYRGELLIDEQGRERVLLRVEFRPEVPEGRRHAMSRGLETELREKVGVRIEVSPWQGEPLFRTEVEGLHKSQRWVDRRRR
jgi:phenylacetate-CoA ligase